MGNEMKHTPGRVAYEADCLAKPNYHDGTTRRVWDELPGHIQQSWERNPRPRWNHDATTAELDALRALVKRIQDALGTGEEGENLVAVARDAARAEMELAARIRKDDEDYDMGRDTATLLANNASLMKDAARYRWLRSGKNTAVADEMFSRCCEDQLDGEIDAALKSCGEV